ncbi:MAG: phosphoribosylamine--glycine ligase [Cytophagaceae bacterium]|nr:phosphoribosylamine--glycine ligase [Cytophagaceae bacterium]
MNILLLGSGGREHAFAWKITQSPLCRCLFVAPGNAGTAAIATNLPIGYNDFERLAEAVREHHIDLLVVGPEEPLVRGVRDYFTNQEAFRHLLIVGPDAAGAQLEGSKDFSKRFMHRHGIPTAASRTFTAETLSEGLTYLETHALPIVLKADGLAAGKGVIIAETRNEAGETLKDMLVHAKFGEASRKVVIEQFLRGIELSVFVLTDGTSYKILPEAKDYKRIGEGDTGPNTGGMGAVSPVPFADEEFLAKVEQTIVRPTLDGLRTEGIHYVGFIFIGLMNDHGTPYVIEYNARMGDPETEAVLPRIESDWVALLTATARGTLHEESLTIGSQTAVTTVLVAGGYPGEYEKGQEISGLGENTPENITVFHAGTLAQDGRVVTNGGRVLAVTALGDSLETARAASQEAAATINFAGKQFRKDIGKDLMQFTVNSYQ